MLLLEHTAFAERTTCVYCHSHPAETHNVHCALDGWSVEEGDPAIGHSGPIGKKFTFFLILHSHRLAAKQSPQLSFDLPYVMFSKTPGQTMPAKLSPSSRA